MDEQRHATVLVVDDDPNILALLSAVLGLSGFTVHAADTGARALSIVGQTGPDIVVLDVMLPDCDGFTLAHQLRVAYGQLPVLFLTARGSVDDRVAGLTAGGADYVTKPFSLEELVLRLRAILRRTRPARRSGAGGATVIYADLELDEDAHEVRRAGELVHLSPREFTLLGYLMVNAGKVVSKTQVLNRVWNHDTGQNSRIVESSISCLRRKIDTRPPPLIHTIRGVGYTLWLPREANDTDTS